MICTTKTHHTKIPIPCKVIIDDDGNGGSGGGNTFTIDDSNNSDSGGSDETRTSSSTIDAYMVPHITKDEIEDILRNVTTAKTVEITIKNVEYYQRALVHKSILRFVRKYPEYVCPYMLESNERLEFVGDAVLGVIVGYFLFCEFPNEMEGTLTKYRARIVKGKTLAYFANKIGLSGKLLMSERTAKMDGQINEHLLENAFEAFVGALFIDRGYSVARDFIMCILEKFLDRDFLYEEDNFKDQLLKMTQAMSAESPPKYQLINEQGKPNEKVFTVVVLIGDTRFGKGRSRKKKQAEQEAARAAIQRLHAQRFSD